LNIFVTVILFGEYKLLLMLYNVSNLLL